MSLYLKELEGEMLEIAEVRVKYGARRLRRVYPDYFGEWPDFFGECKKSAIGRPGAAPGRPRAQKNNPPPRTPPENNILAPQASRVYESTQNKFLECPAAPAAGRRTRAENEPPPPIALEERGAAAHSR